MRPTLFELAGGEAAFLALARAHHARCLADPELNHPFSHDDQHPQHVERLAAYWGEVMGGPPAYLSYSAEDAVVPTRVSIPRWDRRLGRCRHLRRRLRDSRPDGGARPRGRPRGGAEAAAAPLIETS